PATDMASRKCSSIRISYLASGSHPREVMMKHLKKVLLFRVGFDKKVSLVDKFFICDMPSMIKGRGLSPQTA
ncbi:hypothetical protein, partial [Shewanella algae]|uniref:hypothetical protein n=1 Tax=Shewanella algae TaxID=38313 RepID=UPI0030074557